MPPDHRPASPNGNAVANSAVTNNAATDNAVANSAVTDNAVTDSAVANSAVTDNAVTGNPVVDTGGAPTAVSGSRPGSSQPPMPGGPAPMTPPRPAVAPPDGTVSQSWDPPATNLNGSEPAGQAGDGLPADELDDWDGSQFIVTGDLREVFRPPANLGPAEPANGTDGATSTSPAQTSPAQTSPAQTSPDRTSAAQTSPDRTSPAHPSPIRNDKPRVQPSPFPHEESDADRMSQ